MLAYRVSVVLEEIPSHLENLWPRVQTIRMFRLMILRGTVLPLIRHVSVDAYVSGE